MDNSKQATLELGTKPVGKLLIQYALPAIAAMTAASDKAAVHSPSAALPLHSPCRTSQRRLVPVWA